MRTGIAIARGLRVGLLALAVVTAGALFSPGGTQAEQGASSVRPPSDAVNVAPRKPGQIVPQGRDAQQWGGPADLPATATPQPSDSRMWRNLRRGASGTVSIPNKQAAVLIQSQGQDWRTFRNSTVFKYGAWLLLAVLVVLALFFLVRRRIKIKGGLSGRTVERFNFTDRFAHWLTAVSFIILGLTGLSMLYGRAVLIPVLGKDTFSAIAYAGKLAHNYVGYAFIAGILLMIVLWIRDNLPDKYDVPWMLKGGGLFSNAHPPAKKFNAGQKLIFWSVVVVGGLISASGVLLMFPSLSSIQYLQWLQQWHAILALVMIAVIIAHIYIGSLGMVGAFQAMGTGFVDANWAKQHHSVWTADLKEKPAAGGGGE